MQETASVLDDSKVARLPLPIEEPKTSPESSASTAFTGSVMPRIRRAAIVEAVVYLAAVVGFSMDFGDGTRYIGAALHPFWVIVLLICVQYGPAEALTTSLLASAFLLVGNLPEQSLAETQYEYILRISLSPFLWIVTSLVLGSIRARQLHERASMSEELALTKKTSAAIVESYRTIKQSKEHLEMRVAEERRSVLTMYEVAKTLETLDPLEAAAGIRQLVQVALNPKKFSLYRWQDNELSLETSHGWANEHEFTRRFTSYSPLAQETIHRNRMLSIVRKEDEKILDSQGMLAGAIMDEQTGRVFGILKIEETDFTEIGIRTHETFRIVCAWIARVHVNVEAYQAALKKTGYTIRTEAPSFIARSGTG